MKTFTILRRLIEAHNELKSVRYNDNPKRYDELERIKRNLIDILDIRRENLKKTANNKEN